jgi:hypothetical protein
MDWNVRAPGALRLHGGGVEVVGQQLAGVLRGPAGRPGLSEGSEIAPLVVVEAFDPSVGTEVVVEGAVLLHDVHDVLDRLEISARRSNRCGPVDSSAPGAR